MKRKNKIALENVRGKEEKIEGHFSNLINLGCVPGNSGSVESTPLAENISLFHSISKNYFFYNLNFKQFE